MAKCSETPELRQESGGRQCDSAFNQSQGRATISAHAPPVRHAHLSAELMEKVVFIARQEVPVKTSHAT
jgi:hypothetical protein